MPEEDAAKLPFNPFDLTKVWPHEDYPLIEVGVMELNRNPENYFAEVEQAAFNPANSCPASALARTRCCRGGCSPTATPTATGSAPTTTRSRSTPRAARSTATTATAPCASTATTAAPWAIEPNSYGEWQEQPDYREPPLALDGAADHWNHREDDDDYLLPARHPVPG